MAEASLQGEEAAAGRPGFSGSEGGDLPAGEQTYSKDYWDLVFEQLGRRRLFRVGLSILALLYALAIYAPLIANERPYLLEAINLGEYEGALRSLSPVTSSAVRLIEQTPAEYLAARGEMAPASLEDALAEEEAAVRQRLSTMRSALAPLDQGPLVLYEERLDAALAAASAGDLVRAAELGAGAKALARELRDTLRPRSSAGDAPEDAQGVSLVGRRQYPLFESISHWEVLFMVLWAWVLLWPLWNGAVNRWWLGADRRRIRAARRTKFGIALASSLFAAVAWLVLVGGERTSLASAPYKLGLTKGQIVLEHGDWVARRAPVFPPLPMGYAETHPEEGFRPPTWTRGAQVDDEGHYLHGFRRSEPDVMGVLPPAEPVVVRYAEPGANSVFRHLAGTDQLGRDFLVRMIWGSRVSLSVGILSALLLTLIGVTVGAVAGYVGGPLDLFIMRVIEILQSIPAFFLIIVAMAFTDPEVVPPIFAIVFVIAIIRWTAVARLVRGEFLKLREAEFVVAARALGYSNRRTIFRHILPNAMSPVLVSAAFAVASGILTESAVSYLGFGIQHPGASWGSLVNESKSADHWWVQFFPGLLIFVTVTCYNLVGDAIRDALDPKMKLES